jgi:hypothetical protein
MRLGWLSRGGLEIGTPSLSQPVEGLGVDLCM